MSQPTYREAAVDGDVVAYLTAGDGPELVVLLHGWPETAECWSAVLPVLGNRYTVIAPDLPGYGRSARSRHGGDKRAVAQTLAALVSELGHERAFVAGHDRGARVAHRWAMDRPDQVTRLAVLDVIPSTAMIERMGPAQARAQWHWFFHASTAAAQILEGQTDEHIRPFLQELVTAGHIPKQRAERYLAAYARPDGTRGFLDDYRAALGSDAEIESADTAAGRRVRAPVLVLWGRDASLGRIDPIDVWTHFADTVVGQALDCGHYLPEEKPELVANALREFFHADA